APPVRATPQTRPAARPSASRCGASPPWAACSTSRPTPTTRTRRSSPTSRAGGAIARPTSRSPAATAARTCSGPSSASSWAWRGARRRDGGRRYLPRASDFGYSKDYRETLQIWDRQAVLADIVRVIRIFRPDVIVTRFSPEPGPTHGHHTASVVLAVEAFKL